MHCAIVPFGSAKRQVSACKTAHIGLRNGTFRTAKRPCPTIGGCFVNKLQATYLPTLPQRQAPHKVRHRNAPTANATAKSKQANRTERILKTAKSKIHTQNICFRTLKSLYLQPAFHFGSHSIVSFIILKPAYGKTQQSVRIVDLNAYNAFSRANRCGRAGFMARQL